MSTIVGSALANQIQVPFVSFRDIYETREYPSRMYDWKVFLSSMLLVEIPWNIFGSSLLFLSWYWTVGFETSRAGYTYLMIGIIFPLYYTTLAQAVAVVVPSAAVSTLLFMSIFAFIISL